jgi:glucose-1-phosphate thymidylyltransferase
MEGDAVKEIQVKQKHAGSHWIWGAFRMSAAGFRDLNALWESRGRSDEFFGTLVNSYLSQGGEAVGIKAGESYVDVGTIHGYRTAMTLLLSRQEVRPSRMAPRHYSKSAAEVLATNGVES